MWLIFVAIPGVLIQSMLRLVVLVVGTHEEAYAISVRDVLGIAKPTMVTTEAHRWFDPLRDEIPQCFLGGFGGAEEDIAVERADEGLVYPWMRVGLFMVAGAGS